MHEEDRVQKRVYNLSLVIVFIGLLSIQSCANSSPEVTVENVREPTSSDAAINDAEEIRRKLRAMMPPPEKGYEWVLFKGVALQRP